ncbi:hypothetical protein SmJEL517_g00929 [Synchytrium microbalum]|uniref:Maleylacetoacetate isomerase n=1 Tax=Synchytrium microbalum TaxID=1806994 RepID=A0A507C7S2_9FUNG|nr:uncharacterized protein SmJEL517_g00929 [Synchytrium microbalum]TPX37097.1 hypothetical protein SmJEL517_g00929 [Synchytrium microbalum]
MFLERLNALALKGIKYEYVSIDLLNGGQFTPEYVKMNPAKLVPALIINQRIFTQSFAILEVSKDAAYLMAMILKLLLLLNSGRAAAIHLLEDLYPEPALLPKDVYKRAEVRAIVNAIVADTHPLQNQRVLKLVGDEGKAAWAKQVEAQLRKTAGKYCYGDSLTMADCVLVPQWYNVDRWNCDASLFPTCARVVGNLMQLEAFKKSHPDVQPDAKL